MNFLHLVTIIFMLMRRKVLKSLSNNQAEDFSKSVHLRLVDHSFTHFAAYLALHSIDAKPEIDKLLIFNPLYSIVCLECAHNRSPTFIAVLADHFNFDFPFCIFGVIIEGQFGRVDEIVIILLHIVKVVFDYFFALILTKGLLSGFRRDS